MALAEVKMMMQAHLAKRNSHDALCRHCLGFKLVDVPKLGYTTKDKPHPRGELRLKTKIMIPGYFKHPKVSHLALCQQLEYHLHAVA